MTDPDFTWRPLGESNEPGAAAGADHGSAPAAGPEHVPAPAAGPEQVPAPVPPVGPPAAYPDLSTHQTPAALESAIEAPGDWDDLEGVPLPKERGPASYRYLTMGIVIALAFLSGVVMQKHHDYGMSSASASPLGGRGGAGGGGRGGGGGAGAAAAAAAAAAAGQAGGGGEGGGGRTPAVVGTVVSVTGTDVTVKDATGAQHVVHTSPRTRFAKEQTLANFAPGATVSVSGQTDAGGSVDATQVVERIGGAKGAATPTATPAPANG